ncbi:hypothetical protein ANN_07275 [Periplaneta americana]|uniref:Uncharacterized protein n=1 Tax=Periplaneta americana TaxID=6978 RepID=A0ABQ8TGH0_PERAM|nr:hypothetical protein ANN_07275 [Periplaneta americana]
MGTDVAGLFEGGNEPPGSLKAFCKQDPKLSTTASGLKCHYIWLLNCFSEACKAVNQAGKPTSLRSPATGWSHLETVSASPVAPGPSTGLHSSPASTAALDESPGTGLHT